MIERVSDYSGNGWTDDISIINIDVRSLLMLRFHSHKISKVNMKIP